MSSAERGLNAEQRAAFHVAVHRRQNVLVTGAGGTGKTHLIRAIAATRSDVVLCATTGLAASHIGGSTLHSWFGIPIARPAPSLYVQRCERYLERWRSTDALVVDEISMMSAELFEWMDDVFCALRKSRRTWGGIQLILVGDFLQLPPVRGAPLFASAAFKFWSHKHIKLIHSVRHERDASYSAVLERARVGRLTDSDITALEMRRVERPGDPFACPVLFPTNRKVNAWNDATLDAWATARGLRIWSEEDLRLAVGAPVMVTRNLDVARGIVNGLRAVVAALPVHPSADGGGGEGGEEEGDGDGVGDEEHVVVRTRDGITLNIPRTRSFAGRNDTFRFPLRLAWAMTIHKAQGTSLDHVVVDIGDDVFEYSQAYVALSRVRTLAGLELLEFDPEAVQATPSSLRFETTSPSASATLTCRPPRLSLPPPPLLPPPSPPQPPSTTRNVVRVSSARSAPPEDTVAPASPTSIPVARWRTPRPPCLAAVPTAGRSSSRTA